MGEPTQQDKIDALLAAAQYQDSVGELARQIKQHGRNLMTANENGATAYRALSLAIDREDTEAIPDLIEAGINSASKIEDAVAALEAIATTLGDYRSGPAGLALAAIIAMIPEEEAGGGGE